jgi:uncharacterized protein
VRKISKEKKIEQRTLTAPVELRSAQENEKKKYIVGYAAKFNTESEDLGGFVEVIEPGAFTGADMSDVRALFNHDPSHVLGRSKSGTLKLEIDEFGLKYTIDVPNTRFAQDLLESMERGDIDQSSFRFMVDFENDGDTWEYNEERDIYMRTISKFKRISDVSVVTYPAYEDSNSLVATRSLENYKEELQRGKETEEQRKLKQKKIAIELELL